ncbi:MAG TPA: CpsB/CapC family capsule biosynthesis tyrosine phosphatase [Longimicrobiales bacterium]
MAIVDFHNHLMPGVDDGAQTEAESVEALRVFQREGVATAVVTPHVDASLTAKPGELQARLAELDEGWAKLQRCAQGGSLALRRGVELLLDVPEPDLSEPRLRLGGGKFVLMEFPFMMLPPQSGRAVRAIADSGYTPIIAHPERYRGFLTDIERAAEWKQNGAYLQMNGGSLLGRYGTEARRAAFELLERGWVDYLCSDYHARGPVMIADYRALLESQDGAEQAHTLMETNPARMLDGLPPLPVTPLRPKRGALWQRVAALFRA